MFYAFPQHWQWFFFFFLKLDVRVNLSALRLVLALKLALKLTTRHSSSGVAPKFGIFCLYGVRTLNLMDGEHLLFSHAHLVNSRGVNIDGVKPCLVFATRDFGGKDGNACVIENHLEPVRPL